MLKNGERLPVKSIHKLPAGSTVRAVEVTGRLTNGRRPPGARWLSTFPRWRKQRSVMLPHPSPSPISQTALCVYLGTADQRLLNITKAKSIIHKWDKRSQCRHVCRRWEFSQYLKKHFLSAGITFLTIGGFHHSKCFSVLPLLWEYQISDIKSSRKWSHTAGNVHPSRLMRS